MNIKKYLLVGGMALGMGMTSCVGDLDLEPNDPNYANPSDPNYNANTLAMCYSGVTCSGVSGPGSSYVADIDGGASAYLRLIFTLSEFCTDEMTWIWPNDEGGSMGDVCGVQWSANNGYVYGMYYRLMGHIAICNQYLRGTEGNSSAEIGEMRAQARVLRAYSYYNMIDLFGNVSFTTEADEYGSDPVQKSRKEVYEFLVNELTDIVDNKLISESPVYGRVGLDGAEALLAKLYLNAGVFSGTPAWDKCRERCENIIGRHKGGGFQGSGLANDYHYLFCKDNNRYMPGGSNKAENEILFGFAFDETMTQSYGGPTFLIAATVGNTHYIHRQDYGCSSEWQCIRGKKQLAERFYNSGSDCRDDLWFRGVLPAGSDASGSWEEENYSDEFESFSGDWKTTGGNVILKFTGATINPLEPAIDHNRPLNIFDGSYDASGSWHPNYASTSFSSTDQPVIRLADIYLMYAECVINGGGGDQATALQYVNYVRERAGAAKFNATDMTIQKLMDERSRELYLESWRRNDLIRAGYFVGPAQKTWQLKGNVDNIDGGRVDDHYALYPLPEKVIHTQPDFEQNPGY